MRLLIAAFCVASVLAAAPSDQKADEAQLKDVIHGVVGRYLGDSNESQVLSSALMKAFEEEGFGEDPNSIKTTTASPESSTVSLGKRDIRADALPPPELFLDLLGEDLDNPRRPALHMEVAANAKRNCTKRKRRKKKSKTEPIKLPVGPTRANQREFAEYTSYGVPPAHVEIPRLVSGDHRFFDDETSQRPPSDGTGLDSSFAHLPDLKQRNQDKLAALSEHAPTTYQAPSAYFSLGSTSKPSVRRNPFERFEQTTTPPYREESYPESRDVLVPKRSKSRDFRTTTQSPSIRFTNEESDAFADSDPNQPTSLRIPKVQPTTLEPLTDPRGPEVAHYSFVPKSSTTLRPAASRTAPRPTPSGNSYPSRSPEAGYRTLVPSSLNKGTLQHFSFYPKQPQSSSLSKIILAVGGARYAPLPMNFTTSSNPGPTSNSTPPAVTADSGSDSSADLIPDFPDRAAAPTGLYNTVVAKQTSSVAAADESLVIQTPTARLISKNTEEARDTPGTLLPISPKVVSGQVLIFASRNQPEDAEMSVDGHHSDVTGRADSERYETTTSAPHRTTDCVTHGGVTTVRPEFGARMFPSASMERRTTTAAPSHPAIGSTDEPRETSSAQGFMPDAPTILMQVPLPDYPELSNHGYVKGNAQLHIPLVYKLQKKKDKVSAQSELTKQRTLISLPNNPFARLNPVKTAYYKYRESDIKGYLPKAFIRLERVQNVQVKAHAPQRSMVVFE